MAKYLVRTLILYALLTFVLSVEGTKKEGSSSREHPVKALFVFGDSYVDTGNINKSLVASWKTPYGRTYPGMPSGRFSDGRVLTDYVARFLGLPSPIPYARRKSSPHKARHGVNFAYGGTGALDTLATMVLGFPNMTTQIDDFQQMLHGNDVVPIHANLNRSTALVSLVGNDYGTFLATNGSKKHLRKFIIKLVKQLGRDLQRLKSLGFKKILVTGLQPLGCLPRSTASTSFKRCDNGDNRGVKLHNLILRKVVAKLNKRSQSIVILDLYNSFFEVFKKKRSLSGRLKFKDPLKPCCFGTQAHADCGSVDGNGKELYTVCDKPIASFFWDTDHPTQAGWSAVYEHLKPTLKRALVR